MELGKILQGFKDVADNQALLHEEAMIAAHKTNLNGLKRLHRHHAKLFFKHGICIANFALDYGMEVKKSAPKGGYSFADLKSHFKNFIPKLEMDIEKLKSLNYAFIQAAGMEYAEGKCMQECLSKQWMKMKFRWTARFEFTKWDAVDIMHWDKWLHDKIRCLEEAHHEGK
ncbi:MAG: hypothetical protein LBJ18_04145 [Rickettsiales bacterium]|jgi:hypothetical protein|nr:hypothetical protein [Rickettsiales bacterium]